MSFQNPSFLWALFLLAIPLIIHLFNFRRYKRVKFSNVEMLQELESESSKIRQVKKWLILAVRMLAITCLVFAFSLPFIPKNGVSNGRSLVSLYLDNSQSMNATGENGQLFENGKNFARELLNQLPSDMDVQFIDNSLSPYSNKVYKPQQAENLIDNLSVDFIPNQIHSILGKANTKALSEKYARHHFIAISDFQKVKPVSTQSADSSTEIHLVRMLPEAVQNISIDSAWINGPIARPGTPVSMNVKVTNNGEKDIESTTITLKINGVQQGLESFDILSGANKVIPISFNSTSGWVEGKLSVSDVPVVFDNDYYFSLYAKERLRVLNIGKESEPINQVFKNDNAFDLINTVPGRVDYSAFSSYDFILLNELDEITTGLTLELKKFVDQGGALLIIPSLEAVNYVAFTQELSLPTYVLLKPRNLSFSIESLNHPFIRDVYRESPRNQLLPKVKESFKQTFRPNTKKILKLKDGTVILSKTQRGLGNVYMLGLPLGDEYSTFTDHELFVLSVLKMAFTGNPNHQLAHFIQHKEPISIPMTNEEGGLRMNLGEKEIVMESARSSGAGRMWLNPEVEQAGVYSLKDSKGELLAKIGLNYNRIESPQKFYSKAELIALFAPSTIRIYEGGSAQIKSITNQLSTGTRIWKLFVLLGLLFLLIEVLLLRFLRT